MVHVKIKRDEEGLAVEGGETFATLPELIPVSYTHLTLPTIYSV